MNLSLPPNVVYSGSICHKAALRWWCLSTAAFCLYKFCVLWCRPCPNAVPISSECCFSNTAVPAEVLCVQMLLVVVLYVRSVTAAWCAACPNAVRHWAICSGAAWPGVIRLLVLIERQVNVLRPVPSLPTISLSLQKLLNLPVVGLTVLSL